MRLSTVCAFAVMIGLGTGVYNVANRYDKKEKEYNSVQGKIGGEQEAIRVLQAEWTFLTSPDRLEKISDDYLHLQPVDGRQYVALNEIPMRSAMETQQGDDGNGGEVTPPETAKLSKETKTQVASAEPTKKQVVAAVQPKKAKAVTAQSETAQAVQSDDFQKVLAKELAPEAHSLPSSNKKPLPELKAIPVSLTETDE